MVDALVLRSHCLNFLTRWVITYRKSGRGEERVSEVRRKKMRECIKSN